MPNTKAPDGHIYLCFACGKTSPYSHGFDVLGKFVADGGWDISCLVNSAPVPLNKLEELKRKIEGEEQ